MQFITGAAELASSRVPPVFQDREKLSSKYVPERLPHRDDQLRVLRELVLDVVEGRATTPRTVVLVGPTGAGKTSSVMLLSRLLSAEGRAFTFAHVNLRVEGETPFQLFSSLYEKISGLPASRSLGAQELLKEVVGALKRRGLPAVLTFDEVEFHARSSLRSALYAIARLHEVVSVPVPTATVLIARGLEWMKLLDPAERSSLGNLVIRYPPYSSEQLFDILLFRCSEAFARGAIGEDVIKWLADYTYAYMGSDVRRALDVLLYAGILAEHEGCERVALRHVLGALRNLETFIAPADVEALTLHEKLLLYAALRLARARPRLRLSELWEEYSSLLESYDLGQVTFDEFEDLVQRLVDVGALMAEGPARVSPAPSVNIELIRDSLRSQLRAAVGDDSS